MEVTKLCHITRLVEIQHDQTIYLSSAAFSETWAVIFMTTKKNVKTFEMTVIISVTESS